MNENSIVAGSNPLTPHQSNSFGVLGDFSAKVDILCDLELAAQKYPEMKDLLLCMAFKESSFNPKAIGDYGKAKGLFQIHTAIHPIANECAFDVECSLDWTAQKIKEGKGYLWTTYKLCNQ